MGMAAKRIGQDDVVTVPRHGPDWPQEGVHLPSMIQRAMISPLTRTTSTSTPVRVHSGAGLAAALPRLEAFALRGEQVPLNRHPAWLNVSARAFGHTVYALEVADGERTRGYLPLSFVRSLLFGRFLVSLPYLNTSGVLAADDDARHALLNRAADLADELNVRYL